MTTLQNVMPDVTVALNHIAGRRYITDKTAQGIAALFSDLSRPNITAFMWTGEITDAKALQEEINLASDFYAPFASYGSIPEEYYAALVMLAGYVGQWKRTRKPVATWPTARTLALAS